MLGCLLALAVACGSLVAAWVVGIGLESAMDAALSDDTADGGSRGWFGLNHVLALIMVGAPLTGLLLVGQWVRRRGRRRTMKGYWIGVLGGFAALLLLIFAVYFGLGAVGIG